MVIQNSNKSIKSPGSFRGTYSKLNLYFQNAVNCYYEHTSEVFLKDSTVMTRANAGVQFLLYIQENHIGCFCDIKESDVIGHLQKSKHGLPYGRSQRFALCSFLNEISSE